MKTFPLVVIGTFSLLLFVPPVPALDCVGLPDPNNPNVLICVFDTSASNANCTDFGFPHCANLGWGDGSGIGVEGCLHSVVPVGGTGCNIVHLDLQGVVTQPLLVVQDSIGDPPELKVKGHIDAYGFFGGAVILPCIVLEEPVGASPCAVAGGIFVSRLATIIDEKRPIGDQDPKEIWNCSYHVTAKAAGFGLNQLPVPIDMPCVGNGMP